MSSNRNDDYLERVKAEIRAEADAARARAPLPRDDVAAPAVLARPRQDGIERNRIDYAISELTGSHYSAFVDQAFRALLKRAPDDAGSAMQIRLLGAGASKAEVLGNLRWSPEGRRVGTRVRGLLPRYALAKLARVPVLGYFIDWSLALAGLPVLLRHQRAADTSVAARFDASVDAQRTHDDRLARLDAAIAELGAERDRRNADAEAQREHGRRMDELSTRLAALRAEHEALTEGVRRITPRLDELERAADAARTRGLVAQNQIDALNERSDALEGRAVAVEGRAVALEGRVAPLETLERRVAPLETRAASLESRNEANASEMIDLRHYVHAANHWIVSMQASLAGLEEAAAAERAQADALAAALDADAAADRTSRHAEWAARLGPLLPASARVLDLGSGNGEWLVAMAAQGVSASGVEPNQALAARARERDVQVAFGDPLTTLSRCKDADLDAITLASGVIAGDDSLVAGTVTQIRRALKPAGWVILRIEDTAQDALRRGLRASDGEAHHWAALLTAAGFMHAQVLPVNGAAAVLAQAS